MQKKPMRFVGGSDALGLRPIGVFVTLAPGDDKNTGSHRWRKATASWPDGRSACWSWWDRRMGSLADTISTSGIPKGEGT